MKNKSKIVGVVLLATVASGFATIATYSGVYNVHALNTTLVTITKGGFMTSMSNNSTFAEELTPAKSKVDINGKFIGSTASGISAVGQIDLAFNVTGTAKSGGSTRLITGKRFLK